jgi:hypothetical protein
MRYNTGNPVGPNGSSDSRDFHDNAGNLDIAVNDPTKDTWADRTGVERRTFSNFERVAGGLEEEVRETLEDAEGAVAQATEQADRAEAFAETALAAAGTNIFYAETNAAAVTLAESLGDGATVITDNDESATPAGVQTRRGVVGGMLTAIASFLKTSMIAWKHGGTGSVWRTLYARLMDLPVSVKDFGAAGDGIADDTVAIQEAVNYLGANGGGTLLLGKIHAVSGVEVLANNITIKGMGGLADGIGATHIKYIGSPLGSASVTCFSFGQSKSGSGTLTPVNGCKLIGMSIDGNRAGGAIGSAVRTTVFDGIEIVDVHVYDCAQSYGFALVGTGLTPRKRIRVKNCSAYRCGADGLDIKGGLHQVDIDGFETGDHLDETDGDSVGIDLRGQYISARNIRAFNCPEVNIRVRINVGVPVDMDTNVTKDARVNLYDVFSVGGRDGINIGSPMNSVVNVANANTIGAERFGLTLGGTGIKNLTNSSFTECLTGLRVEGTSGEINLVNSSFDRNTSDGMDIADSVTLKMNGGSINNNARYGVHQRLTGSSSSLSFNGLDILGNLRNYFSASTSSEGSVVFNNVRNKNATSRGVQVENSPSLKLSFIGGEISDNATNIHTLNTEAKLIGVAGVVTRSKGSTSFLVDSATTLSVSFTHGLSFTPAIQDVILSLARSTNVNDYEIGFFRAISTSSTTITAQVRISSASATVGATANLIFSVSVRD